MHKLSITLATCWVLLAPAVHAADRPLVVIGGERIQTDVNLVTAIDVSGSIDRGGEKLELIGTADALSHPAVLQAIDDGRHRRIGFAAFTWSSEGDFIELVPWTTIASRSDALRVAERLRDAHKVRPYWAIAQPRRWRTYLETDISAAIERARADLAAAPFVASRSVINICANGEDNVGIGPDGRRARPRRRAGDRHQRRGSDTAARARRLLPGARPDRHGLLRDRGAGVGRHRRRHAA